MFKHSFWYHSTFKIFFFLMFFLKSSQHCYVMFCLPAGRFLINPQRILPHYERVISDFMHEHKYAHMKCQTRPVLFRYLDWDSHGLKYLHNECYHLANVPS